MGPIDSVTAGALTEIARDLAEMRGTAAPATNADMGFGTFLEKSIKEVNDLLAGADKKAIDLASGKSENLHDAMISMEKAETALKLMVQTRNKAIEAYHEIMRMQL